MTTTKKVKLNLIGLEGNAFSLMGAFQKQARNEKWTPDEIKAVLDECQSGDYNHLLATLNNVCDMSEDFDSPDEQEDEDDEDEW